MAIDQPTATMIAAGIAAVGAVTTALINKWSWKPTISPTENLESAIVPRQVAGADSKEARRRLVLGVVCIGVVVYFSIVVGSKIIHPVAVDSRSCALIALQIGNWFAYLHWASQHVGWLLGYNLTK